MANWVKTKLDYNNGTNIVPKGTFRLSASSASKFFSNTTQWYREKLMGEEGFTASSATVLGTCVHYIAECWQKNRQFTEEDTMEVERYITNYTDHPDVDVVYVRSQYLIMGQTLVSTYVHENPPTQSEEFLFQEVLKDIGVGGSCDGLDLSQGKENALLIDYKTTGSLTAPTKMTWGYKLQLLIYAWLYAKQGITVTRIRLVFVTTHEVNRFGKPNKKYPNGAPLKDYPATVSLVDEEITSEDIDMVEGIIKLISESVHEWNTVPAKRYLLAQDYRLKGLFREKADTSFMQQNKG